MRTLRWSKDNSVYVPEIDAEHQTMFEMMQELRRAVVTGGLTREIELLMESLAGEYARHFVHEERLSEDGQECYLDYLLISH